MMGCQHNAVKLTDMGTLGSTHSIHFGRGGRQTFIKSFWRLHDLT